MDATDFGTMAGRESRRSRSIRPIRTRSSPLAPSGYLNISYNAGATWTGTDVVQQPGDVDRHSLAGRAPIQQPTERRIASDVGGAGVQSGESEPDDHVRRHRRLDHDQVPTSGATEYTPVTWTDQSVGIENLVANEIIVPPGGDPVLASWDRPFFYITNPNAYPSTYGPVNSDNIVAGWSVDYASSNPSFLVGLADWWGTEESGYSTNGGQTWTQFCDRYPWRGLVVHGRNDRRQHAAKHHLGAGGRQPALLYAQRRHDLEPDHASRRDQLERL